MYGGIEATNNKDALLQQSPFSLIRSGYYEYGGTGARNQVSLLGFFWEGQTISATLAQDLLFYATYLDPHHSNDRGYGFAIRCLGR